MIPENNPKLERVKFEVGATGVKEEQANPLRSGIHGRGYLPHVKRDGASYFVTFRLADSLPRTILLHFERRHAEALRRLPANSTAAQTDKVHRDLRHDIERYLD